MSVSAVDIAHQIFSNNYQQNGKRLSETYPWYVYAHIADAVPNQDSDALARVAAFVHNPLHLQALVYKSKQVEVAFEDGVLPTNPSAQVPAEEQGAPALNARAPSHSEEISPEKAVPNLAPVSEAENDVRVTDEPVESSEGAAADDIPASAPFNSHQQQEQPVSDQIAQEVVEAPGETQAKEQSAFLPYHTVDYFAALGIKIDPNLIVTTRLDSQMKSFTQWLKSMKRINYEAAMQSEPDKEIQAKALRSLQNNPVLTETMVEVLVKQNKTQQAVDLLEKLVSLHPEKSSLFAARIEALKHQL